MVSPVDLLNIQADAFFGPGELLTSPSDDPELAALMALAERVKMALVPVRPSRSFVEALGRDLAQTAVPTVEVLPSRRRPWIIGAAAVGSAFSILGLLHFLQGGRRVLKRVS